VLARSVAVALEHAGVIAIGAELRATQALNGLGHEAARQKHRDRQKQTKRCFSELHWLVPFQCRGSYARQL
jgi:hypothetical protein